MGQRQATSVRIVSLCSPTPIFTQLREACGVDISASDGYTHRKVELARQDSHFCFKIKSGNEAILIIGKTSLGRDARIVNQAIPSDPPSESPGGLRHSDSFPCFPAASEVYLMYR